MGEGRRGDGEGGGGGGGGGGEEEEGRRGGGDEMHGRLALTPIFLLPNQGIRAMQTLLQCRG